MNLQESKSALAKLLAEENIDIVHQSKLPTAAFDLKARKLYCPIWEAIDGDMYDLLMGHEVSHALHTPTEGWHNEITDNQSFKSILNVCEDARIEKLMKRKYPGLSRPWLRAYKQLHARDFFGVNKLRDFNRLNLADRINLYFKLGAFHNIPFSAEEMEIVQEVDRAETWDDVVFVARKVAGHMEKNKQDDTINNVQDLLDAINQDQELLEQEMSSEFGGDADPSDSEDYDFGDPDEDEDYESKEYDDQDGESDDEFGKDDQQTLEGLTKDQTQQLIEDTDTEEEQSITDQIFRARESELVVDGIEVVNAMLPEPILQNIIEPVDVMLGKFKTYYQNQWYTEEDFSRHQRRFSKNNDGIIQLLVKQFLMKRNAAQYARQQISTSGELDMRKLHMYRHSNDIFAKITVTPKGKSHGIVLFLDLSGSMNSVIAKTTEQLLVLATFCKRVNIPFDIYGFNDSQYHSRAPQKAFEEDRLVFSCNGPSRNTHFHLKHLLSSSFPATKYKAATRMLMTIAYSKRDATVAPHHQLTLNGTPMISTIVASRKIIENFRKQHSLDVVDTIYLTDGEPTDSPYFTIEDVYYDVDSYHRKTKVILRITDRSSRQTMNFDPHNGKFHEQIMQFIGKITGATNIGFYVGKPWDLRYRLSCTQNIEGFNERKKQYKDLGFYSMPTNGFDSYFNVRIKDHDDRDVMLNNISDMVNDKKAVRKLATDFSKNQVTKKADRIFTTALMDYIC